MHGTNMKIEFSLIKDIVFLLSATRLLQSALLLRLF